MQPQLIAVIGPGQASEDEQRVAEAVGAGIAASGCSLVCGGLGGVMAAACRGFKGAPEATGLTIGILPGLDPAEGNPWLDVALPTGTGEGRNLLVVRAARAVIAIGGAYGTLAEIALALRAGMPVFGIDTWELVRAGQADPGITVVPDAATAVAAAVAAL